MSYAAAITAVNQALAHFQRRQAHAPTDHSAREVIQMSMLAEYLHEMRAFDHPTEPQFTRTEALHYDSDRPLKLSEVKAA